MLKFHDALIPFNYTAIFGFDVLFMDYRFLECLKRQKKFL